MRVCGIGIFYPRGHKIGVKPSAEPRVLPYFVTPRVEYPYPTYPHMKESYSIYVLLNFELAYTSVKM